MGGLFRGDMATQVDVNAAIQAAIDAGLGVVQAWQNVTASRGYGTVYTNTTGKPILICVTNSSIANVTALINGTSVTWYAVQTLMALVPPGATYTLSSVAGYMYSWMELR